MARDKKTWHRNFTVTFYTSGKGHCTKNANFTPNTENGGQKFMAKEVAPGVIVLADVESPIAIRTMTEIDLLHNPTYVDEKVTEMFQKIFGHKKQQTAQSINIIPDPPE